MRADNVTRRHGDNVTRRASGSMFFALSPCHLVTLSLCLLAGCANRPPAVTLAATVRGASDSATITDSTDGTAVAVMNPTGIGAVRIQRQGPNWPPLLAIRLAYSPEKEFQSLRTLNVRSGGMYARTSGLGSQDVVFFGAAGGADYRGTYRIDIERRARYLQIVLPPEFLKKAGETIELEWVDQM